MNQENTEVRTARYVSKYASLKINKKRAYTKEVDGQIVTYPGERIQFEAGHFATNDPEIIEYMDNNNMNGRVFFRVPDDEQVDTYRKEKLEDLEAREARLAAREKELEEREARATKGVSTSPEDQQEVEKRRAELMELTGAELEAELEARDLPKRFNNKAQGVERIIEVEFAKDEENASSEGDGAAY